MDKKKIVESNRKAWNEALPYHQKGRSRDLHKGFAKQGFSVLDKLLTDKLNSIGLENKTVVQLCCNNGRELLSTLNLGARKGYGVDISDAFIGEANELRDISGLDCEFIRNDILALGSELDGKADLVLITIGALCWIPDLTAYFKIVGRILNPGGDLIIYEEHPYLNMLAMEEEELFDPQSPKEPKHSYFKAEPWAEADGLDYYGGETYDGSVSYSYSLKLSDILNPIVKNGMQLIEMNEYLHDISNGFAHLGEDDLIPKSMMIHAVRKD